MAKPDADVSDSGAMSSSERLMQTLAGFRELPKYSEEATWLRLTETLLLFCRRNRPSAAAWDGLYPGLLDSVLAGVEATLTQVLDAGPASRFPAEGQLDALAAIAEQELARPEVGDATLHAALVARGLAGGIDAVHGEHFVDWFRSQIEYTIEKDSGYVTPVHDPRPFTGQQHVSSRPDRVPSRGLDVVPHLRLGDDASAAYRFVLDFDMISISRRWLMPTVGSAWPRRNPICRAPSSMWNGSKGRPERSGTGERRTPNVRRNW